MENNSGSDVFIMGGLPIVMSLHGRKVPLTKRKMQDKEVIGILSMIYGDNAPSMIGSGEVIDTSHDFKIMTGMDDYENELYERYRYRVNAVSCLRFGNRSATLTIRSIPTTPKRAKDLGIEKEIVDVFMNTQQGLVLVVGATGNGKSTTLAALIRDMLEDPDAHRNFVSIEAPIEFVHDGYSMPSSIYSQMEIGKNIKSFHKGVECAMRMAPTTILVGETRNYETVTASVEASRTGHFVATTLHANSVDETFQRMVGFYPEDMQGQARIEVVSAIKMVVAQRLIPTVDGKRTAIRSFLILDQQTKNELYDSKNIAQTAFSLVERYGKPMMQDVEEKYKDGIISEGEYKSQQYNYNLTRDLYK
jgi:defect-in-organelle-trafficking protein DotB